MSRWPIAAILALGTSLAAVTFAAASAQSAADSAIAVSGNRHVEAAVIRSYFHPRPDGRFDPAELDAALKGLYATGLFADVKIARTGDQIVVTIAENPTIRQITFEGNRRLKDADLKKVLQSKVGGPLSRPLIQGDVQRLAELYRQHGYYQIRIDPQTIHAGADRVNLVFTIAEGDKLAVRQIRFAGNAAFAANKLTGVIKTGQTNLLSFLLNNDVYDPDKIANDCELLLRFYRDHGYADARVRSQASYDAGKKGVVLTFAITEGAPYRLGKVAVESVLEDIDPAQLRAAVLMASGDMYDAGAAEQAVDALTMELARRGKPFAAVAVRTERDPQAHTVDLVFTVGPGRRLYVERIVVRGNAKTHDDVIRREFDIGEGDPFNRALIERAERRLKALGYFKTVKIATEPGSAPDRIVLDVTIQEQDTGNLFVSGGYSTTYGLMAEVSVGDSNLFGTGDIAKAKVMYGQYARGFDLAFTDPYSFGQHVAAGVELFGNQIFANPNQSYDSFVYGAKLSAGTPLTDRLGLTWTYSIYDQGISLDPADGLSSLPIQQAAAAGPIWVSSLGASVTYSTLDNAKSPTSGLRVQTNNEFAGLGGAARFAKSTQDVRYYHPIAGDLVGMARTQTGYATSWGGQQLPLLDGFFGGPQLIRGFATNGFGPRDVTPGTAMDNLGGNIYWTTSAELQAPVPLVPADAQLKMALFTDAGSLWATGASSVSALTTSLSPSQQITNSRAVRASAGVGLVWDSPFGALQVDYAYPFAKQSSDVTQRLNFSAGGF